MDTAGRLRAMALLCRQTAARHPDRGWKLLAEAEYWEHLANDAPLEHVDHCSVRSPLHREHAMIQSATADARRERNRIIC